ncbi:MAG: hypothetical protein J6W86_06690 [Bacteroidales bacterium]|nr:hypothetical protein [Bacteroidales bacterium]
MAYRIKISAAILSFVLLLLGGELRAQFSGDVKDSLRVLCVRYDNCSSGVDGVLSISAIMECDSVKMPTYMVGDSILVFFSDIKADNIKSVQFLYGRALPKKLQKSFPNGIISITLNDGEDFNSSQVFPDGDNLTRKAFVTRMAFSDMASGITLAQKAAELVDNYGTDDQSFRNYKYFNPNRVTPILAIDSLNRKIFVRSFNDFKPEAVGEVIVYNSEEAQQVVGDKGVNGLVIVEINPKFTLQQALVSPVEKAVILINEMYSVNFETMMRREVLYIK